MESTIHYSKEGPFVLWLDNPGGQRRQEKWGPKLVYFDCLAVVYSNGTDLMAGWSCW